jgi:high affinity Mn2+ porin
MNTATRQESGPREFWTFLNRSHTLRQGINVSRAAALSLGAALASAFGTSPQAADSIGQMPLKAPPSVATPYDWTGFYIGAHLGYATGYSKWSATEAGAAVPNLAGSLDFFHAFDGFKGSGSYLGGLQAGYTYMFPSRLVVGAEADVTFPNSIGGAQVISSAAIGQARYDEMVQFSGTVRGRIGYSPGHWLVYATGGFAWTYNEFTRTQIVGTPVGGTAAPDTVESLFMVSRFGGMVGAGVEVALPSHWTARLEYLFTQFGTRSVGFPAGAQRFDSDLTVQSIRLGFNYRPGASVANGEFFVKGPSALDMDWFSLHGQTTYLQQYAFPFHAPYHGPNSLVSNQGRETWDVTFYAGVRLWQGAELWVNPEIDQGFGLSGTLGVAGFTSGEAYKVGASVPYTRLPRMFVRQTIDLGGETQKLEPGINQFAGSQTADRLVITIGKFSVADIFDTNKYSHDPRSDFFNWSVVETGTFDYAADSWGYTYGAAIEWYRGNWTMRGGVFDLSIVPNSTDLDPRFQQFQWVGEIEHRHELWGQPGKVAVTGFLSRGRMGRFADAIQLAQMTGEPADIIAVRHYASRGGVSVNVEQQVSSDLGVFARAGWANGDIEPYEFTDIDRTVAAGLALNGKRWGRPDDTFGLAGVVNGITSIHQAFLNAGGLGILVGDGQLPNYGAEKIIEMYYSLPFFSWRVTFDCQFITNPAYNRDRGPVSVIGTRLRAQF